MVIVVIGVGVTCDHKWNLVIVIIVADRSRLGGWFPAVQCIRRSVHSACIGEDGDISEPRGEYSGILNSDVMQLVQYLKQSFRFDGKNDAEKLFVTHGNQFASQGANLPWARIAEVEAQESTRSTGEREWIWASPTVLPAQLKPGTTYVRLSN